MAWTNDKKDWDYKKPFHRINSPSWDPDRPPVDGKGYARGCHAESDGPTDTVYGTIIKGIARAIPGWVSVEAADREQELEGILERSFQTWTDVPVYQWHRYYDWNFHIIPARGYDYVRGKGNREPPEAILGAKDRRMTTESMECEWDCGAFGPSSIETKNRRSPGAMFNNNQWIWPMTGQYCWTAGRWIYDCGHASSPDKSIGLMRSEIHPVKAMATAQWEGVKFAENGNLHVPGIRFLFFASRNGGYWPFDTINDRDYEFIVDLPKNEGAASGWRIGHTPEFPLNTAVLRAPHVLHSVQFLNVGEGTQGTVQPVWEPIPPAAPDKLPEQVKVKIPLTQLPKETTYYGVIINFGWFDPDQSQARRVKHCRIRFDHLHKADVNHDVGAEEWLVKFAVNGRWYSRYFGDVHNDTDYPLNVTVPEFFLADTDGICISSHGAEMDQMDDVFQEEIDDRKLRLHGQIVDWKRDVVAGTADPEHNAANRRRLWDMVYEFAGLLPGGDSLLHWLGIEDGRANNPLGMIDPMPEGHPDHRADNPLAVKTLDMVSVPATLVAYSAQETGESAELIERRTRVDYVLHFEFSVIPQLV